MDDLWILYNNSFDTGMPNPATRMLDEAINNNINAKLMFVDYFKEENNIIYYKDKVISLLPKIVLMRANNIDVAKMFEKKHVKIINSTKSILLCRDKYMTHKLVNDLYIPQIKTELLNNLTFNEIIKKYNLPFILKYRYGKQGENIYLIDNELKFNEIIKNINKDDYIIQEYIKESYGVDIRVLIVEDEIIGAVKRENKSDFKSNLAQGGLSYDYKISSKVYKDSLMIAKKIGADIVSVDYLISKSGLLFCEANTNPGFNSFCYLGYDVRKTFMHHIKEMLNK